DLQLKTYTGSALDPSNNVQITGFTQLDDYTWEINVSGIPQGKTFEIGLDPASVQDLSAVENGVQVLGETTIRFEVASANGSTSANGTLANTGVDSLEWMTAMAFLMIGFALVRGSRKKEIKSIRRISL
ncbi:MAG TPA: LPXTG cell wall anchor domain-containing protein, partial [Acidimicrobiia bacterium]|nr:LPXTG cell wall anchor domain-containing protein [Acidimicrobiia bacterium]